LGDLSIPWKWNLGLMVVQLITISLFGTESLEDGVLILAVSTGFMPLVVYRLSEQLGFSYFHWIANMTLLAAMGLIVLVLARNFDVLLEDVNIYSRVAIVSMVGFFVYAFLFATFKMHKKYR